MALAIAPLQAHLALIKKRLLIIGATIIVCFGAAFVYAQEMIDWMARSLAQVEVDRLAFYGPTEALFAAIKVSFLVGIVLSLPMILTSHETRSIASLAEQGHQQGGLVVIVSAPGAKRRLGATE